MTAAVVGAVLLVLVLMYTFLRSPVTASDFDRGDGAGRLGGRCHRCRAQPDVLLAFTRTRCNLYGSHGALDCSLGRYQQEAIAGVRIRVILERPGGSIGISCRRSPLDPSSRSQRLPRSLARPGCSWCLDIRNRLCSAFQDCDIGISGAGVPNRHVASRVSELSCCFTTSLKTPSCVLIASTGRCTWPRCSRSELRSKFRAGRAKW